MYARQQFAPPRIPSQTAQKQQSSNNLLTILQKQSLSNRITIPEMYIGDDGAMELAAFLRGQQNITMIDLKGNNITSRGFVEIFNSLRNNYQLKSLNLEWNRLGAPDISGLEALYQLMINNRSITHLDLRNNKINQNSAHIIANFIRNNNTLASLDIRWNELGNNGARAILGALEENCVLVGLELAGNGASEEINQQVQLLVGNNRDGVPHQAGRGGSMNSIPVVFPQPGQPMNQGDLRGTVGVIHPNTSIIPILQDSQFHSRGKFLDQVKVQRNIYGGIETLNLVSHLEIQIENERINGLNLKEDISRRIGEVKEALAVKAGKKKQLEEELISRSNEHNILRSDLKRTEEELKNFQTDKSKSVRTLQERSGLQEQNIRDTDKRLQSELLGLSDKNIREMREVDAEWSDNCDENLKKIALQGKKNDDCRIEIYKIMDDMVKSEFRSKDEAKEVVDKLRISAQHDYADRFHLLETGMNEHVQKIMENERQTKESVAEHTRRIKNTEEKSRECIEECTKFKMENEEINMRNREFELFIERQTKEFEQKEQLIEKLKKELNKLNSKDTTTDAEEKDVSRRIQEAYIKDHDTYNELHDASRDRITQLEKTLRESNAENLRLRGDFQRLGDLMNANLQKTTYQSFIDQKVM